MNIRTRARIFDFLSFPALLWIWSVAFCTGMTMIDIEALKEERKKNFE